MFENPITNDGDSSLHGESLDSTSSKDLSPREDTTTNGSDNSPSQEEVDIEAIKAEKRAAVTEAKKRFHESETARAEASTLRTTLENAVQANPDLLLKLQQDDPQLADSIANKLYGESVDDLVARAQRQQQPQNSYDDIRRVIREETAAEERKREQRNIERLEVDFFVENDIDPKSPQYKSIMSTYNRFKPKTLDEAKELLELAYAKTRTSSKPVRDINQVYSPSFGSSPTIPKKAKQGLSDDQKSLGKMLGIQDKYL